MGFCLKCEKKEKKRKKKKRRKKGYLGGGISCEKTVAAKKETKKHTLNLGYIDECTFKDVAFSDFVIFIRHVVNEYMV